MLIKTLARCLSIFLAAFLVVDPTVVLAFQPSPRVAARSAPFFSEQALNEPSLPFLASPAKKSKSLFFAQAHFALAIGLALGSWFSTQAQPLPRAAVAQSASPAPSPANINNPIFQRTADWILNDRRISAEDPRMYSFEILDSLVSLDPNTQNYLRTFAENYDQALAGMVALALRNRPRVTQLLNLFSATGFPVRKSNKESRTDTGNIIWTGILAACDAQMNGVDEADGRVFAITDAYLRTVLQPNGGVRRGPGVNSQSTEHNIDALIYWSKRYKLTPTIEIQRMRLSAAEWLLAHYDAAEKRMPRGENDDMFVTDVHALMAMALLSLREGDPSFYDQSGLAQMSIEGLLDSVERVKGNFRYRRPDGRVVTVPAFRYSPTGPGTIEWSWQVTEARYLNGQSGIARTLAAGLSVVRLANGSSTNALSVGRSFPDGWKVLPNPALASSALDFLYHVRFNYFFLTASPFDVPRVARADRVQVGPAVRRTGWLLQMNSPLHHIPSHSERQLAFAA